MSRHRIDLEEGHIDVQFDGEHELTEEEIRAFRELADAAFERMDQERCETCGERRHEGSAAPLHPCHDCPDDFHGPKCPSCGFRRNIGGCADEWHTRRWRTREPAEEPA